MIAWMFPGQGSQKPRMDQRLAATKGLIAQANQVLGSDIGRLFAKPVSEWPAAFVQPAIFITSVAAGRAALDRGLTPGSVVGHSLGEYAALTIAGGCEFEAALELVATRGKAMARAGRANSGGMAAILGLPSHRVQQVCDEIEGVWVANYNTPSQTVVSGRDGALAEVAEASLAAGADRVVRLRVPVAAHTPLMASAQSELKALADQITFKSPEVPFYSPVDAAEHSDPDEIRELLITGITSPVRFAETIENMAPRDAGTFIEIGAGRVLQGLVGEIVEGAQTDGISSDEDVARVARAPSPPIGAPR